MQVRFEENPNCGWTDDRVFSEQTPPQVVTHVLRVRGGQNLWCPIVGWNAQGSTGPAQARKVQDSGEGTCYLVYGSLWGLRLKMPDCADAWSLDDPHQWGESFLLLSASGEDLRFI
jgi:hypothetical protein